MAAAVRRALAAVLTVLAIGGLGCAEQPDRTLHPDRPAVTYRPLTHPFEGAKLAVDPDSEAARYERATGADWLQPIAGQPQARWINSPQDLDTLPEFLAAARDQRALPVLVAYWAPNRGCSKNKQGAPTAAAYAAWIRSMIARLDSTRAVVILEPDAVSADCFDACTRNVSAQGEKAVKAAIDAASASECGAFHEEGCNRVTPPCAPPALPKCNAGLCE